MWLSLRWTDGETYEVEDPLENYDDIRDSPDITQTEAEVHESPPTAPDVGTAPLEQEQSSNDYLVPGQDGWAKAGRYQK